MPVTVFIPSPLRQFTGGAYAVQAAGATAGEVLAALTAAHPALRDNLLAGDGRGPAEPRLQPFVHAFVNGRDIAGQAGLATPVPDGGELLIVQAISGG